MCNGRVKVQILKWLQDLKIVVLNVYCNIYYLRYKHTSIAEIHLLSDLCPCVSCGCFMSPWMNVHCTVFVYMVTCPTAQNMGSFEFAFFAFWMPL
jgi:hypothetical protein